MLSTVSSTSSSRAPSLSSSDISSSNWASLNPDLLGLILDKLVSIPDYIRFSAVCKPWNSLALSYKEKRLRLNNNHQLPWLLLTHFSTDTRSTCLRLYSFINAKMSNFQPPITYRYTAWHSSSHGWLFASEWESPSITLLNPLSGAILNLPPMKRSKIKYAYGVGRLVLSRDPSSGSFEVLASFLENLVAHLKYGDKFWTYSSGRTNPPISFCDVTFYGDRILGVACRGRILSIHVVNGGKSSEIKFREIAPELEVGSLPEGYFVETRNGDLLMVHHFENIDNKSTYEVYKLITDSNGKFERLRIVDLGGESLFLGLFTTGISVLASDYPGCMPNAIYCEVHEMIGAIEVEVFNLEDGSIATSCVLLNCNVSSFPTWVVPSMKL